MHLIRFLEFLIQVDVYDSDIGTWQYFRTKPWVEQKFFIVPKMCLKQRRQGSFQGVKKLFTFSNPPADCSNANIEPIDFVLSDRYKAKPRTEYWSTKGEVLESFFNRFLRKIRLL